MRVPIAVALLVGSLNLGCAWAAWSQMTNPLSLANQPNIPCQSLQEAKQDHQTQADRLSHYSLAQTLACHQKYDEAIALYQSLITKDPDFASGFDVYVNLGDAYQAKGDLKGAIATYRTAIQYNADPASGVYEHLASALQKQNQPQEAAAVQQLRQQQDAIARRSFSSLDLVDLAQENRHQGQLDAAIGLYKIAIERSENDPDLYQRYFELAELYLQNGQEADAIAAIRSGGRVYPHLQVINEITQEELLYGQLGNTYIRLNRLTEAQAAYQQAANATVALKDRSPQDREAIAQLYFAEELAAQDRIPEAIGQYQHIIKTTGNPKAYLGLAQVYEQQQQWQPAIALYQQLQKVAPADYDQTDLSLRLGNSYLQTKNFRAAQEIYQQAIAASGTPRETTYTVLRTVWTVQDLSADVNTLDDVLHRVSPLQTEDCSAVLSLPPQTVAKDAKTLEKPLDLTKPANAKKIVAHADQRVAEGRYDDAIKYYQVSLKLSPSLEDGAIHGRLGRLLMCRKQLPEAITVLSQGVALDPWLAFDLAAAYEANGQRQQAIEVYSKLLGWAFS
jgi:tetratricopeptide (TPR) repeat protein